MEDDSLSGKYVGFIKSIPSRIGNAGHNFKEFLQRSSAEVVIGALIGAIGLGYNGVRLEMKRAEKIPLAFSEVGQVLRNARSQNIELGPSNLGQLMTNEMNMKVFEAYNNSSYPFFPGTKTEAFAEDLEIAMTYKNIYHFTLGDLLKQTPDIMKKAKETMHDQYRIYARLKGIDATLENAYSEYHEVIEKPVERKYEDSDGNEQTETVWVYDHTDNTFTYHPPNGEKSIILLQNLFKDLPNIKITEKFYKTDKTNADGEYAAEKSRGLSPVEGMSEKQHLDNANTWFNGSTIIINDRQFQETYPDLKSKTSEWSAIKKYAITISYPTYDELSTDPGPEWFQKIKSLHNTAKENRILLEEMVSSVDYVIDRTPILHDKINRLINAEVYGMKGQGDSDELKAEIMNISKTMYKGMFKEGINPDRFRVGAVILWALAGATVLGLAGFGLDKADQRWDVYERIAEATRRNRRRINSKMDGRTAVYA